MLSPVAELFATLSLETGLFEANLTAARARLLEFASTSKMSLNEANRTLASYAETMGVTKKGIKEVREELVLKRVALENLNLTTREAKVALASYIQEVSAQSPKAKAAMKSITDDVVLQEKQRQWARTESARVGREEDRAWAEYRKAQSAQYVASEKLLNAEHNRQLVAAQAAERGLAKQTTAELALHDAERAANKARAAAAMRKIEQEIILTEKQRVWAAATNKAELARLDKESAAETARMAQVRKGILADELVAQREYSNLVKQMRLNEANAARAAAVGASTPLIAAAGVSGATGVMPLLVDSRGRALSSTADKGLGDMRVRVGTGGVMPYGYPSGAGITAAVGAFGMYEAIKQAAKFDEAMHQSLSIMGTVSDFMKGQMKQSAMDLAAQYGISAIDIEKGFYHLTSAGFDAQKSLAALPTVVQFAFTASSKGVMEIGRATELLTTVSNALGATAPPLQRIADLLVLADSLAAGTGEQFAESLAGKGAGAVRILGKDLEEALAMLATLAKLGIRAKDGQQALVQIFRDLRLQQERHKEVFIELNGVHTTYYDLLYKSNGEMRNMADIFRFLEKALEGATVAEKTHALATLGLQQRTTQSAQAFLGFSDSMADLENKLRTTQGKMKEVADIRMEGAITQFKQLRETIRDVAIDAGGLLLPPFLAIAVAIKDAVQGMRDLKNLMPGGDITRGGKLDIRGEAHYFVGKAVPTRADYASDEALLVALDAYTKAALAYSKRPSGWLGIPDYRLNLTRGGFEVNKVTRASKFEAEQTQALQASLEAGRRATDLRAWLPSAQPKVKGAPEPGAAGVFEDAEKLRKKAEAEQREWEKRQNELNRIYEIQQKSLADHDAWLIAEDRAASQARAKISDEAALHEVSTMLDLAEDERRAAVRNIARLRLEPATSKDPVKQAELDDQLLKVEERYQSAVVLLYRNREDLLNRIDRARLDTHTANLGTQIKDEDDYNKHISDSADKLYKQWTDDWSKAAVVKEEAERAHQNRMSDLAKSKLDFRERMGMISTERKLAEYAKLDAAQEESDRKALESERAALDLRGASLEERARLEVRFGELADRRIARTLHAEQESARLSITAWKYVENEIGRSLSRVMGGAASGIMEALWPRPSTTSDPLKPLVDSFRSAFISLSAYSNPAKALQDVIASIQNAGTAAQANAIAVKYFGTTAGPMLASELRKGTYSAAQISDAIKQATKSTLDYEKQTNSTASKISLLWKQVAYDISVSITKVIIEQGIIELIKAMTTIETKSRKLGDVMVEVWKRITGQWDAAAKAAKGIGGALSGTGEAGAEIWGLPTAGSPGDWGGEVSGAAGAAGGVASSAGSATGAAGKAVGGGLSGALGAVFAGVTAASSVVSLVQTSHGNALLGKIEVSTRGALNELLNFRADAWTRETHLMLKLDDIWNSIRGSTVGGAGSTVVNIATLNVSSNSADDLVRQLKALKVVKGLT